MSNQNREFFMNVHIETTESVVSELTGELLSFVTEITEVNALAGEPNYLKLYIEDLGLLKRLSDGEINVLLGIATVSEYSGEVHLPLLIKQRIANSAEVKIQTINNIIAKLISKDVIKRIGTTVYILNPDLFAKEKWRDIREQRKTFQSITTYNQNGTRTIEIRIVEPTQTTETLAPADSSHNDDTMNQHAVK